MTAVTRLGLYGGSRSPYGSFAGKALSPPVFAGTIPDISVNENTGTHIYDLSSYFTGASSYSISPSVEAGWTFSLGVLTIDTDAVGSFGPFTVTGTNASGSDSSNAFSVTISAIASSYSGGWWYAYDLEDRKRRKKKKELLKMEEKANKIQSELDKELALELRKEVENQLRIEELTRLTKLAQEHEQEVHDLGERVTKAYQRATIQYNYSALEALEREIQRAREEEDWLINITLELMH